MSWTLDQLKDVARWTIWPLLQPLEARVAELKQFVMELGQQGGQEGPAIQVSRTQEFNFSATEADDNFFSRSDVATPLVNAQLLYRAVGGERITRIILSAVPPGDDIEVEIQRTDYTRGAAVSFPSPIVLTLSLGSELVEVLVNQPLVAGDCLVAVSLGAWAGIRVDGTLFIES